MSHDHSNALLLYDDEKTPGLKKHVLPPLPYKYVALEPHIDMQTLAVHHDKHHASYVNNLNTVLEKYPEMLEHSANWLLCNLSRVPKDIRTAVRRNAGGHVNHSLYWRMMSPAGGGEPTGSFAEALCRDFGSFEKFKESFEEAGNKLFGSGWLWLVSKKNSGRQLKIITTTGHDNPSMQGRFPILVNDIWEHAYYLRYENRRADYLKNWWSVVNWAEINRRFESLLSS